MFGKFYVFFAIDYKVVTAYVPGVGLQFIKKNVLGLGKEY